MAPIGEVGGVSWTVAFGREIVLPPVAAPGRPGRVPGVVGLAGATGPDFSAMVGAGFGMPAPGAVLRGIVAAGAGRGAPPTVGAVAVGAERTVGAGGAVGEGGRTTGAVPEEGDAGGASAALRVTRTVSFLSGMLEVCFDGVGSFSLMRRGVFEAVSNRLRRFAPDVSNPGGFFRNPLPRG